MSTLLDTVVEPCAECLTPVAAEKIIAWRASPELQSRVDELAVKANEGSLSEDEKQEYDRILAAYHFVTLMQLRAKQWLGSSVNE